MIGKITILLLSLFHIAIVHSYDTYARVELYADGNCGGSPVTEDLNNVCYYYPDFGYDISGVFLPIGSCVILYKGLECTSESYILGYPEFDACNLPCCGWNDHVLSVSDCYARTVTVNCPTESYIREIEFADAALGMTIHCYKPTENEPTYSMNTHGSSINNPERTSCPIAAHGLTMRDDAEWTMLYDPHMECTRGLSPRFEQTKALVRKFPNTEGHKGHISHHQNATDDYASPGQVSEIHEMCATNTGLTGVEVLIDDVGVMKQVKAICREIPDPTQMCEPLEMLGLVVQCDNSESGNVIECGYSKTVGVGKSISMTEREREEMEFSAEFGFTVEGGIPGLSASMSTTLGYSELVGYEWSVTDETTWSEETMVSATIVVRPYTNSKLEQLVGKCSFYGTNVNYFKQTDVNVTSGVETVSYFRT